MVIQLSRNDGGGGEEIRADVSRITSIRLCFVTPQKRSTVFCFSIFADESSMIQSQTGMYIHTYVLTMHRENSYNSPFLKKLIEKGWALKTYDF